MKLRNSDAMKKPFTARRLFLAFSYCHDMFQILSKYTKILPSFTKCITDACMSLFSVATLKQTT